MGYTLSMSLHWYLAFKQKHVIQQIWQPGLLSRCGAGLDQSYLFVSVSTFEQSIPIERLFFNNSGAEIRSKCWMWFSKTWIVERRRMDHCGLVGQFPPTISSIKNLQFLWAKRQSTFHHFRALPNSTDEWLQMFSAVHLNINGMYICIDFGLHKLYIACWLWSSLVGWFVVVDTWETTLWQVPCRKNSDLLSTSRSCRCTNCPWARSAQSCKKFRYLLQELIQ